MQEALSSVLERLRREVAAANHPGNIEGLLSRLVLGEDARLGFRWSVDCNEQWLESEYDPMQLPRVSALGYTVHATQMGPFRAALEDGLIRAAKRDPNMVADSVPVYNPSILLGLILGAKSIEARHPECMAWCVGVVKHLEQTHRGTSSPLLAYCAQVAATELMPVDFTAGQPLVAACAADWLASQDGNAPLVTGEQRQKLRAAVVQRAVTEDMGTLPAHQAAFIWRAALEAVAGEAAEMVRSPHTVVHVLQQFESCLRRWRWDDLALKTPVRWPIVSEREVQDVLWLMLRSTFLDLADEDTLPKFGHSTYRADFGIPSLGVLIEVKFAREATDFKKIEKEVLEDIVPYLKSERYKQIVVFIYDDSGSVQEHELTRAAFLSAGLAGVVIASRPSMLPKSSEQTSGLRLS